MIRFAAVLFLLANSSACVEKCVSGESVCAGDHRLACGGTEGDEFRDLVPGCKASMCVETHDEQGLRIAVCSDSGEPDPRCDDRFGVCADETTRLRCERGFSWDEKACGGLCITRNLGAFCSEDTAPSPVCVKNGPACEGDAAISCRDTWVTDRIACREAESCIASPFTLFGGERPTYCASEVEACEGTSVRCVSAMKMRGCVAGRAVEMTCNAGSQCETFTVLATGANEAECVFR